MSIRVSIEQYDKNSFKVYLDGGKRKVSGVSVGVVAALLKMEGNNKLKLSKKDVAKFVDKVSGVAKSDQDRSFLEALMLLRE